MITITETMILQAVERIIKALIPPELIEHLVSREIRQRISTIALEDAPREQGWELRSFRRFLARKGG